ncbi:MAG: lysophospholipid acyltransferase family protein [Deltaproteobacteria bacterium]|nr:lysophospholipid acyltransferase family protein [Deltaproteobacteria bacterium]
MSLGEWILKQLLYLLVKTLSLTYKIKVLDEGMRSLAKQHHVRQGYLLAVWHEHLLSSIISQKGQPLCALVSASREGRLIGYVCRRFGYTAVHGSQNRDGKDKGGFRALIKLVKLVEQGSPAALTVDGSVGPRREVKAGVIDIARRAQAAILPFACVPSRYWTLPTWDRFQIPKPFATIVIKYGRPISIPAKLSREDMQTYQSIVADAINKQEMEAQCLGAKHRESAKGTP